MHILLFISVILFAISFILDIKTNKLQQETLEEMLDFCEQSNKEQLALIKELNDQNLKMRSREKLSIILLKQLNEERAKRKDIENNLEFITSNIEDTKLKEVIVAQNK